MKPLVVHPEAEAELQVTAGYYEERVAGLGIEFLEEICDGHCKAIASGSSQIRS